MGLDVWVPDGARRQAGFFGECWVVNRTRGDVGGTARSGVEMRMSRKGEIA